MAKALTAICRLPLSRNRGAKRDRARDILPKNGGSTCTCLQAYQLRNTIGIAREPAWDLEEQSDQAAAISVRMQPHLTFRHLAVGHIWVVHPVAGALALGRMQIHVLSDIATLCQRLLC